MLITVGLIALFSLIFLLAGIRLLPMFTGGTLRMDAMLSDDPVAPRYRPMERLLREDDWRYLATQQGLTPRDIRCARAARRSLFRRYVRCLSSDFAQICSLVRILMVQSSTPRPDLAKTLLHSRVVFAMALLAVEGRLLLHATGFRGLQIDVSSMLASLETLREQLQALQVAVQPAAA